MLLHKQRSLYFLSDREKVDVTDLVLVAINEVTKFNPEESNNGRSNYGIDFSNIVPVNPHVLSCVLEDLGYKEVTFDTDGVVMNYWDSFEHHDNKNFPTMQISGTAFVHECRLHGMDYDRKIYPHLERNPKYASRINHGLELLYGVKNRF